MDAVGPNRVTRSSRGGVFETTAGDEEDRRRWAGGRPMAASMWAVRSCSDGCTVKTTEEKFWVVIGWPNQGTDNLDPLIILNTLPS
jgi:hypothetical protein